MQSDVWIAQQRILGILCILGVRAYGERPWTHLHEDAGPLGGREGDFVHEVGDVSAEGRGIRATRGGRYPGRVRPGRPIDHTHFLPPPPPPFTHPALSRPQGYEPQ